MGFLIKQSGYRRRPRGGGGLAAMAAVLFLFMIGITPGHAQQTSADFSGGSVKFGYDNRACSSGLAGAIRYYDGGSSGATAYCWGRDNKGQLGNGAGGETSVPGAVSGGLNWVQISAGSDATCAIDDQGDAYCWGEGSDGQIGDGNVSARQTPTKVSTTNMTGDTTWEKIAVGWKAACGVATDGKAYCWGFDESGGSGNNDGNANDTNPPELVYSTGLNGTKWVDIMVGDEKACGIRDSGHAYCWGYDASQSLGNGAPTSAYDTPQLVLGSPSGTKWVQLSGSWDNVCGVRDSGDAYCWGSDGYGQIGCGGSCGTQNVPYLVSGGHSFASISVGDNGYYVCGVTTAGAGYCWGDDTNGKLGNGAGGSTNVPGAVSGSHTWAHISAGDDHVCGLTTAGDAYCWGYGANGRIGDNNTTTRQTPVLVSGGITWTQVVAAGFSDGEHSCGIEEGIIGTPALQYCNGTAWTDF